MSMQSICNVFVVFLDVDGVLNTWTTCERTPDGYTGIDDTRVAILASSINNYHNGSIVLSSDWKKLKPVDDDYIYLISKLKKYGISISGHTQECDHERGAGIIEYLDHHPEIEDYVILDDNTFDFRKYTCLWERLLLTNGIENAKYASITPAVETIIFLDYIQSFHKMRRVNTY